MFEEDYFLLKTSFDKNDDHGDVGDHDDHDDHDEIIVYLIILYYHGS